MSARIIPLVIPVTPAESLDIQGKETALQYFWAWRNKKFNVSYPRVVHDSLSIGLDRVYYDYRVDWLADDDEKFSLIGRRRWLAQQKEKESGNG